MLSGSTFRPSSFTMFNAFLGNIFSRNALFSLILIVSVFSILTGGQTVSTRKDPVKSAAAYRIQMGNIGSQILHVNASLRIAGKRLLMDTTRSGEVPELGERGWPALIRNLKVSDRTGRTLAVKGIGPEGWELVEPYTGILSVSYEVDYSIPAANNWPAPREIAFVDASHFSFVGRSVFITTEVDSAARVNFVLKPGWHAVTAWTGRSRTEYSVEGSADLVANLIVLTNSRTVEINVGGFRLWVTPMGHWNAVRPDLLKVLNSVIPRYLRMMKYKPNESYSVVLLPTFDQGAESYRNSFAFNSAGPSTNTNRPVWGHMIAHEIFHYWNGWRLKGKDYASSQWFQEGFTDYAADLAMVTSGLNNDVTFRERLATQIAKYRNLKTPLAAPGNQKGTPLYGGGSLVAFCWDIQIRRATGNKLNLEDVIGTMWRQSNYGVRKYDWKDIKKALDSVASGDWESFYRRYIEGTEGLPLDETFALAGLRITKGPDGVEVVEIDDKASQASKATWASFLNERYIKAKK